MFTSGDDDDRADFTRRSVLFGGAQVIAFGVLGARLYELQVMQGDVYRPLADKNRLSRYALEPMRGKILDRRGVVLADTVESFRCYLTPALAGDVGKVLEALSPLIELDESALRKLADRARRSPQNLPVVVADDLGWEQAAKIGVHAPYLPGVQVEPVGRRIYNGGSTMGHIVGYVGAVERFALDDQPELRLPGIRIGKTGVERGMDNVLRGRAGAVEQEVDARGRVVRQLSRREAVAGRDVQLTIDRRMQARVHTRLAEYRRASSAVIDTDSGEIIALASSPGYNPTGLTEGISAKNWRRLQRSSDHPMLNRAIQGLYPPGSTFKMVTALAAIEAGVIRPGDKINCSGAVKIGRQRFRCWNRGGHGPCNLHRALRESCDVYFYEIARTTGMDRIARMGERLGLGQVFDIGLSAQEKGLLPSPDWKRATYGSSWYTGETLLAGIGQGYVLTTPLQLAVMTARLATGRAVAPQLAFESGVERSQKFDRLDVSGSTLRNIRRAMRSVVAERAGTGRRANLGNGRFILSGKTGTSQVTRLSSRVSTSRLPWRLRDHALFVGYVYDSFLDKPAFAISTIIEHGGSGGKAAAPLTRRIAMDVIAHRFGYDDEQFLGLDSSGSSSRLR